MPHINDSADWLYRSSYYARDPPQVTGTAGEEIPVVSRALGLLPRFSVWMKMREREDPFQAGCNLEFMKQR